MEKKNITLSVAIAVYNEELNIEKCLSSIVSIADEIIIVDGGSTDQTVSIAKKYTSHIIQTGNPQMFHINKQKALAACIGTWILQLDADEKVSDELRKEILQIINAQTSINGYYLSRKNYFWGHWMRKGGQYPDNVIRLVRNGKAKFPCKSVHEQITVNGEVGYLKESLDHYSYSTKEDYWKKADKYTSLTAMEMAKNHLAINTVTWITYSIVKPLVTFISIFFIHKGFFDGIYGLMFAYWSALHHVIAYKKYVRVNEKEML